jgi:hypothetical protein
MYPSQNPIATSVRRNALTQKYYVQDCIFERRELREPTNIICELMSYSSWALFKTFPRLGEHPTSVFAIPPAPCYTIMFQQHV